MRKIFQLESLLKRRVIAFFYLLLLALVFPLPGFGQHYNFKTYSVEDGLGQSQIFCLFLDRNGYLWAGTNGGGLSKFDGKTFANYTTKDGLSDNVVYSICEDREGNLWFGTDNGINKYDGKTFANYTTKDGLSNKYISSIMEDNKGRLWIGTSQGGVNKFDGSGFTHYSTKEGLNHNKVNSITQDRDGILWFGTDNGAAKYDGTTFTRYTVKEGLIGNIVRFILQDSTGILWFATNKGVSCFDGTTFSTYTTRQGLCGDNVNSVMENSKGNLWFATTDGISHFNGRRFTTYTQKEGLPNNNVRAMLKDREGNLWFGSDDGLSKFSGNAFTYIGREDGLRSNVVWSIWEDKGGTIWLSTEDGIGKYNEKNASLVVSTEGLNNGIAYPFFEDSKGNLWFGTGKSIIKYKYNDKGGVYNDISKLTGIGDKEIFSIEEDRKGNLWFGTNGDGVLKYDGKSFKQFLKKEGLINEIVSTIKEDKKGDLWFGTNEGISIYNGKNFTNIPPGKKLNNRYVMAVLEDSEGNIWIGTYGGGVTRYIPAENKKIGSIETFTIKDGLGNNEVLSMSFDNDENLWIGTNKGISVLDTTAFKRTGKKRFKNYSKEDGFIGIECNQNAVFKDSKGNLWFGTVKGAVRYNPREDKTNPVEPSTHITGLKLFLEAVDLSPYSRSHPMGAFLPVGLTLPHFQNYLTFEFIGISFTVPEKVRYQVKLEGFDASWSPVSKAMSSTYSNLPPGPYTFKVKACNNNGIWNKEPVTYCFTILAPFWKQWWFYMLCVTVGTMGIFGYIKIRTRTLEKHQQVLEGQVQQRTLELEEEKVRVEQLNRKLEQRVQERTKELTLAHQQLVQALKMEAVGTLAGGVAHDLNNVLAGIVTYPDLLLTKMPEDNPWRKYISTIKKTGEKAAAIVQDLLTLARRGVSTRAMVNLNQMIAECMDSPEMGKLKFYHPDVQMETSLEPDLLNIAGSPIHLSKTFMNLISNAAEAMPKGGKITIFTQNQYIDQPIKGYDKIEKGDYVVLTISDNGKGISAIEVEQIFDPFYTKKEMGKSGTGLGMTVVWSTVRDHNGYITVESKEGIGTTIALYFPVTREEPIDDKFLASISDYRGNGETILVVDDVAEQREVASLMLEEMGYSVSHVSSGEEAVDYISKNPVDLLVLDMIMVPGIDGLETYKRILKLYPKQKAIIASGFSETERVREVQRIGAGAYIKKPYRMEEIGRAVKEELKGN